MKINSIINRYVFMEMLPPFLINLAFFTFIFLLTRILEITSMIVNYKVGLFSVMMLLVYSMPFFLEFIIPMSVMMAVLLTFLRMSGDNEITALKAAGISLHTFLVPVLIFCLMGCLLTAFMGIYGMPWGKKSFNRLALEVAKSNIDAGLKERTFIDSFKGVMLYVNKIDLQTRSLVHVFIEEEKQKGFTSTVVAPSGKILSDSGGHFLRLRLFDGTINQVSPENRSVNSIKFDRYEISLDLKETMQEAQKMIKNTDEMSMAELRGAIRNVKKKDSRYYSMLLRYYEKFSIPMACFALGILAIPLGLQSNTERKSTGIITGLFLFLSYYMMFSVGWSMGESGTYPPVIGMWLPNVVTGGIGIYLFFLSAKDRYIRFDFIPYRLKSMFKDKR